jgi:hypothetical protein
LRPADEAWVELRPWTRVDAALTAEHTRLVHELPATLKSSDPVVLDLFDDLSRPTALAFLAQWADPRDSRALSVSPLTRWLRQQRYPNAEAAAAQMPARCKHRPSKPRPVKPGLRSVGCGPWSRHGQPGKPIGARSGSRSRSF